MNIDELFPKLSGLLDSPHLLTVGRAFFVLVVGLLLGVYLPRRLPLSRLSEQHQFVVRRVVKYLLISLTIAATLQTMGVSLGVLLGTAGILTVAIGFAAQTSASNLISGIFLMAEQPFVVGDIITVGGTTGKVVSVDLFSVRLKTFDNLLVRIPNETVLKSNVTNVTHFPIRRYDLLVGVAYRSNIAEVRTILEEVAFEIPICLDEPKPLFIFLGFGDSALNIQFSVWSTHENFLELRNTMHERVKERFEQKGIEIPFPQRTLTLLNSDSNTLPPTSSGSDLHSPIA